MPPPKRITASLREARELLTKLIAIPSVTGHEHKLADYLRKYLSKQGLETEVVPNGDHGPSILARHGYSSRGLHLLFYGHLDTVEPVEQWGYPPFSAVSRGDRLYGLGSLDMKGGIAAMLLAASRLRHMNLRGQLIIGLASDEELYSRGCYGMIRKRKLRGIDAAISAEPTGLRCLDVGRRGRVVFELMLKGRGGHAVNSTDAVDAVKEAAMVIRSLNDPTRELEDGKQASFTVLHIEGGTEFLSIPDSCRLILDRHLTPSENSQSALHDFRRFISSLGLKATVKIRIPPRKTPYPAPYELSPQEYIITAVETACLRTLGWKPQRHLGLSAADDNYLVNLAGIPTVTFGPEGSNYHGPDEYVLLPSVVEAANVYVEAAALFLTGEGMKKPQAI